MEMGTLVIDIDGTLCSQEQDYAHASPLQPVINKINNCYNQGYHIVLFTARGSETGIDWADITKQQLEAWGVKYHELMFGKPAADLYIDDKALNVHEWCSKIDSQKVVEKPWGREYWLAVTDQYAFKRLEIDQNQCISKQYHEKKHETWHIVSGKGLMNIEGHLEEVYAGRTVILPPNTVHQIMALSDKLVVMEASTIELDDVIRIQRSFDYNE